MAEKKSMMKFKRCIAKLKRYMQFIHPVRPFMIDGELDSSMAMAPEGYFTVIAGKDEKDQKRFVIELRHLRNPALLKLLKEAEDEYGFQQEGALVVPCTPQELMKILGANL